MNYIANSAPRDGSAILASFNQVILKSVYHDPNAKFDSRKINWIGSLGKQTGTCLTWYTSPARTLAMAMEGRSADGSYRRGANARYVSKIAQFFPRNKSKIITGYSTPGMRLAVENGEVDGICGVAWETHMASSQLDP